MYRVGKSDWACDIGGICLLCVNKWPTKDNLRNSKIPKEQTEIVKSKDRQDHGQQNKMKDKHRTHDTSLKTIVGVTRTLQK